MRPVCRMLVYWLCFVACLVWVTEGQFEKEGSGHLGIVPKSVCLLGGGTGCETARKGVTCSRVGGACLS